ncbi:MAG: DUF58 domain-containing protein [Oscillospiraceae bacterium]|jgi:uncharacterized protein (DUF58 family)|nr:DUF58 domain-containing protein [Oscillospiraceae bacterium]
MEKLVINEAFLQQLETLQSLLKNNVGGMFGGNHKSKTWGSSCEFADHRDYADGDDTTKINWNLYARTDKLYLKQFLDERQMHTRIYIDASRSMSHGKTHKAEQALKIAAAFAYLSICEMDKVSIYIIRNQQVQEIVSNIIGKESFVRVINKLNEIEFDGDSYISDALMSENVGYGDGMSLVISDFLTDHNYEDAIEHMVSKKRHVICVQVLSREELNPLIRGKVHFFDSENMEKTYRKNIDKEIAKAYKLALNAIIDRIKDYCLSRDADYLLVPDDMPIGEVIFEKFMDVGVLK